MGETSWTLRLVLLVIGVGIIAAVYVYGVALNRRRRRRYSSRLSFQPRRNRDWEPPDMARGGTDYAPMDEVIAVRVRKVEPISELPEVRNDTPKPPPQPSAPSASADAPAFIVGEEPSDAADADATKGKAKRPRKKAKQMDLGLAAGAALAEAVETANPPEPVVAAAPPPEPSIIAIYLRPRVAPVFVGPAIVRNVNAVGMRHGDLQIFHHHGNGEAPTPKPVFSLANMFEPGYFDMKRIEAFQTEGLVMFMPLPGTVAGAAALELFLATAQRLAEGLRARLLGDPQTLLDTTGVAVLRERAERYLAAKS